MIWQVFSNTSKITVGIDLPRLRVNLTEAIASVFRRVLAMKKSQIIRRTLPAGTAALPGIPEFLSRIYQSRGLSDAAELELRLQHLQGTGALMGLDKAVELLVGAITGKQRIMIIGDFDADGATSTAVAVSALKAMGSESCSYLVPNRFEYGYGLTPEIVELAAQSQPDLIVTVDNGISSIEGVERAQTLGMKVLITDHHLPGDVTPSADAIVNPNQHGCHFASKNAAGVGVIFYVLSGLRGALREAGWFESQGIDEPSMAEYLDLVALGTVADLVPLDRNNRILVEQGLRRIRAGKTRPGIRALLNIAGKRERDVVASDMGFILGPRLNAAGRLDDMSLGIECLLSSSDTHAHELASQLDQFNRQRKQIEEEMKRDAEAHFEEMDALDLKDRWGLCLYQPHWHQGVIGILASRVKEKLHRPVVVFAPESDDPNQTDGFLKGSARSISGFHMRDALDLIAKGYPGLLNKFGGHAMAAGMTIRAQDLGAFQDAFNEVAHRLLDEEDLNASFFSDGELGEQDLNLSSVELLGKSGPWGQAFPEPAFDNVFKVAQTRVLKDKHLKLVLQYQDGTQLFDAIQFNSAWVGEQLPETVRAVYRPSINEFRGRKSVQLMLDYIDVA